MAHPPHALPSSLALGPRRRFGAAWAGGGACRVSLLCMAVLLGCGHERPDSLDTSVLYDGFPHKGGTPVACDEGATKCCFATLGVHNGVTSCYRGTQVCRDGTWGPCQDGTVVKSAAPPAGARVMSLNGSVSCDDNPCDPTCQVFEGTPETALTAAAPASETSWVAGTIQDLESANWPPGLFEMGLNEPCQSGLDCQYDQYCYQPQTDPACAHDKCTTGPALASTCDACVSAVCAQQPACCTGAWTEACVDAVGEVCGSFCPATGTCAHDACLSGGPLDSSCDPCVAEICALDPDCCTGAWDNHCVAKVGAVCNRTCLPPAGDCRQYSPYEANPSCAALPDLTAGVPCGTTIPICNRGAVTVPAHATSFFYFPGMSASNNTFATCEVSPSLQNTAQRCVVDVAIPPGECRNVACSALGNNGGIVVNPPPMATHPTYAPIDECSCQNNWSLYKKPNPGDPPCSAPACASHSVEAHVPTVNLYLMFDRSGSMEGPRWDQTTGALRAFLRDPASAGLRVALRFFPSTVGSEVCGGSTCTVGGCTTPRVSLGTLLAVQGQDLPCASMPNDCAVTQDPQECELVKAIRCTSPGGFTPLLRAQQGATAFLEAHTWDHPSERSAVVLVTDGHPEGLSWYPAACRTPPDGDFLSVAEQAYRQFGVVTHTINVEGGSESLMQGIAAAGHGEYFFVSDAAVGTGLAAALNQIRTNTISCDLSIESPQGVNPLQVSVTYSDGVGAAEALARVQGDSDCGAADDRWYFDDNAIPTRVTLCPATCQRVRSEPYSKLDLSVGCPTVFAPETYVYTYSGSCPPGARVQWGHLTWSASTPGDALVRFEGRTSDDLDDFSSPPGAYDLSALGIAHGDVGSYTTDTQICSPFGPAAECPVDLYEQIGIPGAHASHLELHIEVVPATTGGVEPPALYDWEVTYSCAQLE